MSAVLEPIVVGGLELPNKLVLAPMCTWLAEPGVNEITDRHIVHYANIAMGGAGLIIVEAAPVEYRGRIDWKDVGIWSDRQIAGFRRLNDIIHKTTKSKTGIQLGHCGRKGNGRDTLSPHPHQLGPNEEYGAMCIAPSAIAFHQEGKGPYRTPKEATISELKTIKKAYVQAARRAVKAGFDMIEIHSAHGYLLCSFTSPLSNQRTDEYGGSLKNRCRFPLEVVQAVREAIPKDMPLFVRISASEWVEGGFTPDDSVYYAKQLVKAGADMIHVSSGANSADQMLPEEKYFQIPLAERIKKEAGVPVIAVGNINTLSAADEILKSNKADLVAVGRAILNNPYWLRNEAERLGLEAAANMCPKYQMYAYGSLRKATLKGPLGELPEDDASSNASFPTRSIKSLSEKSLPETTSKNGLFICCGQQTVATDNEFVH